MADVKDQSGGHNAEMRCAGASVCLRSLHARAAQQPGPGAPGFASRSSAHVTEVSAIAVCHVKLFRVATDSPRAPTNSPLPLLQLVPSVSCFALTAIGWADRKRTSDGRRAEPSFKTRCNVRMPERFQR